MANLRENLAASFRDHNLRNVKSETTSLKIIGSPEDGNFFLRTNSDLPQAETAPYDMLSFAVLVAEDTVDMRLRFKHRKQLNESVVLRLAQQENGPLIVELTSSDVAQDIKSRFRIGAKTHTVRPIGEHTDIQESMNRETVLWWYQEGIRQINGIFLSLGLASPIADLLVSA